MMLDIAALQHMYGADFTTNAGDTVYRWTPGVGAHLVDGEVGIDPGGNRIFATIWDGGGSDTYDLSAYATDVRGRPPARASTRSSPTAQLADLGGGPNGGARPRQHLQRAAVRGRRPLADRERHRRRGQRPPLRQRRRQPAGGGARQRPAARLGRHATRWSAARGADVFVFAALATRPTAPATGSWPATARRPSRRRAAPAATGSTCAASTPTHARAGDQAFVFGTLARRAAISGCTEIGGRHLRQRQHRQRRGDRVPGGDPRRRRAGLGLQRARLPPLRRAGRGNGRARLRRDAGAAGGAEWPRDGCGGAC